jgi:HTH-type transcriptional regulator/antitoxin HigA
MEAKVIRTEDQYFEYLGLVENLISRTERLSASEANQLDLLTVLIESYENGRYPIEPPDPIDAILFRMEEKGLKQADLVPFFGTSSRVSEVLKRKRPLTVQMIKAVSLGLGISAETLLGLSELSQQPPKKSVDWSKFPIKEMVSRGWIQALTDKLKADPEKLVEKYISDAGLQFGTASFRRSLFGEAESPSTQYALYAWVARVIQRAREKRNSLGTFDESCLSSVFLRELAQLSWSDSGPSLAIEFLEKHGIAVIIEPHLKGTRLDGAALKDVDGVPIVALTLRFDRLDSFWFTLLHEVVHVWKHVTSSTETFVDDLAVTSQDRKEAEANRLAREAFIPRLVWKRSEAYLMPSTDSIDRLAKELRIHPSIIVGRLHRDTGDYSLFSDKLGHGQVRSVLAGEV